MLKPSFGWQGSYSNRSPQSWKTAYQCGEGPNALWHIDGYHKLIRIFLPRLNYALNLFQQQQNIQPLRTAGHKTPRKIFLQTTVVDFWQRRSLRPTIANYQLPHIPELSSAVCPLSDQRLASLQRQVNPLQNPLCLDTGKELFLSVLRFMEDRI